MLGHPEVQNTAASMSDDEKAIQHAERKGWNREKVHRSNGLAVIVRNAFQRSAGSGSFGARCTQRETVRFESLNPSFNSSP